MRAPSSLLLAVLALAGCAKYPNGTAKAGYTRLAFRFRMDAPVDPRFIYLVAIRPLTVSDPVDDGYGPVPVYAATNGNPKNGVVEGRPTRYVVYAPGSGTVYQIGRFGTRTPDAIDDNPIDLANQAVIGAPILSVDPDTSGDPNTLGFDIQTSDLVDDPTTAKNVYAIQFNIIATNVRLTNSSNNGRVVDSLGDQLQLGVTGKGYYRALLVTSGTYSSSTANNERQGDTLGGTLPSVDIDAWSLTVSPQ